MQAAVEAVASESNRQAWIADHDAIFKKLSQVSRAIERLGPGGPTPRRLKKIAGELKELLVRTEKHFQNEERQAGLFDMLGELLPDDRSKIDRLRAEHKHLLQRMTTVHAQLAGDEVFDLELATKELSAFLETLLAHEALEEQLAERGFNWQARRRA